MTPPSPTKVSNPRETIELLIAIGLLAPAQSPDPAKAAKATPAKAGDPKKGKIASHGLGKIVSGKSPKYVASPKVHRSQVCPPKQDNTVEGPYGLRLTMAPSLGGPASTPFTVDHIRTIGTKKADIFLHRAGRVLGEHETKAPSLRPAKSGAPRAQGHTVRAGGKKSKTPSIPQPEKFSIPR